MRLFNRLQLQTLCVTRFWVLIWRLIKADTPPPSAPRRRRVTFADEQVESGSYLDGDREYDLDIADYLL